MVITCNPTMDYNYSTIRNLGTVMDGIYAMYYTGTAGSGHAVLAMKDGVIAGADAVGGLLDGTYEAAGDGNIDVSVTLKSPPGTWLVTGKLVEKEDGLMQKITATLPRNFGRGNSIGICTPTGPVNVIFKRLRDAL